jgi:asparagine synthase (glutamine-hydrolysing)
MCGITGIFNFNGEKCRIKDIKKMCDALAHRGPDDKGYFIDNYLALGHRRLSIIDLSSAAHQPMFKKNTNLIIIYNGEIYNYRELKEELELKGHRFYSESDTEVVISCFDEWGADCLNKLNGMFAFAIWDKKNRTLTIARDRYGIKPLYYWQNDKVFLFSSEIKSFLKHPQFQVDLDLQTLVEYFTFQNTFTYRTLFKGVRLLPPGCFMEISLENTLKISTAQYWDFCFKEEKNIKDERIYLEELDRLFKQAVRRHLVSDVEIGSYLSGGIDSGSIVAVASQNLKSLKTFCIGFDLSSASGLELSFDETEKARCLSKFHQTQHYQMVLKSGDMMKCLPQLVYSLEDLRLGQSYPNYYAAKLASEFVKVCLSGGGGDELFAGYPWRYYRTLKRKNFEEYIHGYYKYWQRLVPNSILKKMFSPVKIEVVEDLTGNIFRNVIANHRLLPKTQQDYINHSLYFEAKTFLHGLLNVEDKLSMAHGLEVRFPFLDNDLVDFALKVPIKLKLRNIDRILNIDEDEIAKRNKYFEKTKDGKILLRKVLQKYSENNIANQHKQGFSGPDSSWFKGESINYVKEILLNKKANIYNYFDYKITNNLIQEHISGRCNRRLFIWSLLCFEWWLKIFIFKQVDGFSLKNMYS